MPACAAEWAWETGVNPFEIFWGVATVSWILVSVYLSRIRSMYCLYASIPISSMHYLYFSIAPVSGKHFLYLSTVPVLKYRYQYQVCISCIWVQYQYQSIDTSIKYAFLVLKYSSMQVCISSMLQHQYQKIHVKIDLLSVKRDLAYPVCMSSMLKYYVQVCISFT